ncbi:MAG: HU family DNA-binding protein [Deltaproteobacteria bacterium]|nr:HU family DNA-binding protein [Deltaproteobacteria bacterium]
MTKAEFIEAVAGAKGMPELTKKEVTALVEGLFAQVEKAIAKGKRFSFPGFGTFTVRKRAARKGRNPRTGKAINIKASSTVAFKPAPAFKDKL